MNDNTGDDRYTDSAKQETDQAESKRPSLDGQHHLT